LKAFLLTHASVAQKYRGGRQRVRSATTNPANPPAGQKQGGAVEQKEESAKFDPRSIGARQAHDGHWYVPDQSRLGKYLTPTHAPNEAMAMAWVACCSPDALINGSVEPGQQDTL
jgi:hypothetical protein